MNADGFSMRESFPLVSIWETCYYVTNLIVRSDMKSIHDFFMDRNRKLLGTLKILEGYKL